MRKLLFFLGLLLPLQAEIVDRLAIAVGQQVITELQIDEELRLTAFLNHAPVTRNLETRRAAADRLVEQSLIRHEMEVSRYPLPDQADVIEYFDRVRTQNGGPGGFYRALKPYDLSEETVKEHLELQLSTLRFIDYRFSADAAVSDSDIEAAYRREIADRHDEPPTLDSLRESIRRKLAEERTDAALNAWLEESRKQVNIVYLDKTLQ